MSDDRVTIDEVQLSDGPNYAGVHMARLRSGDTWGEGHGIDEGSAIANALHDLAMHKTSASAADTTSGGGELRSPGVPSPALSNTEVTQ